MRNVFFPRLSVTRDRRFGRRTILAFLATTPVILSSAKAQSRPIRVGILSGEDEDIWHIVQENARTAGLIIEIIPFSEGTSINAALVDGDLDANAFQHGPYLQAQNTALGAHIVPVVNTYFAPIGFYSKNGQAFLLCRKERQLVFLQTRQMKAEH